MKLPKHLKIVLKEMHKRVGADFSKFKGRKDWFLKYTWTEKEQDDFIKWLVRYWRDNKEARMEMLLFPLFTSKKRLEYAADVFILNYGWKCKYDKKNI